MATWTVDACTCGFNGGDTIEELDSVEAVTRKVQALYEWTDATVRITTPDGRVIDDLDWIRGAR